MEVAGRVSERVSLRTYIGVDCTLIGVYVGHWSEDNPHLIQFQVGSERMSSATKSGWKHTEM